LIKLVLCTVIYFMTNIIFLHFPLLFFFTFHSFFPFIFFPCLIFFPSLNHSSYSYSSCSILLQIPIIFSSMTFLSCFFLLSFFFSSFLICLFSDFFPLLLLYLILIFSDFSNSLKRLLTLHVKLTIKVHPAVS